MSRSETASHYATTIMALLGTISLIWQLVDWQEKRTERVSFNFAAPKPNPETVTCDLTFYVSNLSSRPLYVDTARFIFRNPQETTYHSYDIPVGQQDKMIPVGAHQPFTFAINESAVYYLSWAIDVYVDLKSQTQERHVSPTLNPQLFDLNNPGGCWGQIQYARTMKEQIESKKVKPVKPPESSKPPVISVPPNNRRQRWH